MKRLFTLIILLGLLGAVVGCQEKTTEPTPAPGSTNAPTAPAAPSTNAAK